MHQNMKQDKEIDINEYNTSQWEILTCKCDHTIYRETLPLMIIINFNKNKIKCHLEVNKTNLSYYST